MASSVKKETKEIFWTWLTSAVFLPTETGVVSKPVLVNLLGNPDMIFS